MTTPASSSRRAFTLLEMLIAVSLGSAIVLIATAGLRAASMATTTMSRMTIENALMRMAAEQALDEVDFWTTVDSVSDKDRQPLRNRIASDFGGTPVGQAFTPFAVGWPAAAKAPEFAEGPVERQSLYHPSPMTWAAHDPRTWCRVNGVECDQPGTYQTDLRHGDYSLFGTADPQDPSQCPHDPTRCRSWYDQQIRATMDAMGFYGFCEYLPSSAFFAMHGRGPLSGPAGSGPGHMPSSLLLNGGWINVNDTNQHFMRGRERCTSFACFCLPNRDLAMVTAGQGRSPGNDPNRVYWYVGSTDLVSFGSDTATALGRADLIDHFLAHTGYVAMELDVRPASWPEVRMTVHRLIKNGRFVNLCIITCFDPASGQSVEIPFTCFGTTLRGARQQRAPKTGWADYDNRRPENPLMGACLDHPQYSYESRLP